MSSKLTKQGVRDLNSISAPKRQKAVLPPKAAQVCNHKYEDGLSAICEIGLTGERYCRMCGKVWDWW